MHVYDPQREIACFLFPRLNCRPFLQDDSYRKEIIALAGRGVGGFVLFEGSMEECAEAAAQVRAAARRPLLLAADCEYGLAMRFTGATEFPSAWGLGETGDPALTREVGRAIALEMRLAGLDWNFAPVLDANTNPANPIINLRAFGESPERVAEHGIAYLRGLADGGILSCGKHFPGHGDTSVDSHIGLPVLERDASRLAAVELLPFRRAIDAGIPALMSAHLSVPAFDPSGDPASLSEPILSGLLRGELGFRGVLVTDALDMGAIAGKYGSAEASVRAFLTGNDVLEIPADPVAALEGLERAVREGRISAERIAESGRRLDALHRWRAEQPPAELPDHWQERHDALALKAARAAIRVTVKDSAEIGSAPRANGIDRGETLCVIVRDETAAAAAERLRGMISARGGTGFFEVESGASAAERERLAGRLSAALGEMKERDGGQNRSATLLLALMIRPRGGAGTVGAGLENDALARILRTETSVLLNFGNPYLFSDFDVPVRVDAFSSSFSSLRGALDAL